MLGSPGCPHPLVHDSELTGTHCCLRESFPLLAVPCIMLYHVENLNNKFMWLLITLVYMYQYVCMYASKCYVHLKWCGMPEIVVITQSAWTVMFHTWFPFCHTCIRVVFFRLNVCRGSVVSAAVVNLTCLQPHPGIISERLKFLIFLRISLVHQHVTISFGTYIYALSCSRWFLLTIFKVYWPYSVFQCCTHWKTE